MGLTLQTVDTKRRRGHDLTHYINNVYFNTKTKTNYIIKDVVWIADTDEWGFDYREHKASNAVYTARSFDNFFGKNSSGEDRFIPAKL